MQSLHFMVGQLCESHLCTTHTHVGVHVVCVCVSLQIQHRDELLSEVFPPLTTTANYP